MLAAPARTCVEGDHPADDGDENDQNDSDQESGSCV